MKRFDEKYYVSFENARRFKGRVNNKNISRNVNYAQSQYRGSSLLIDVDVFQSELMRVLCE